MAGRSSSRRKERERLRRRRQRFQVGIAAAVLVVVAAVVAVLAFGGGGTNAAEVEVDMVDFGFRGDLVAPAGEVRLSARNVGRVPHNIGVRGGPITNQIPPGGTIELDLGVMAPGTYQLYCDIVGHEDAGMIADLVITEPGAGT